MAEVITWRQMAGPNFSGTAAAMDAGADRINQMAAGFQQLAQDQSRIQAEAKAKLKADNTARALSQLSGINDLNQLNEQMPNFTYDSLTGAYGKDIDAGLVAQTAAKQAGVIQSNQLREMEYNIAKETPIMGEAKETIAGLLNKGDLAGAKEAYAQYMPKLTDASSLADMITQADTNKFEREQQLAANARDQKRTDMAEEVHNVEMQLAKANQAANDELVSQIENVQAGKQDRLVFKPTKGSDLNTSLNNFNGAHLAIVNQSQLDEKQKVQLNDDVAKNTRELAMYKSLGDKTVEDIRKFLPTAHPEVDQFSKTLAPDVLTMLKTVKTPEGALREGLKAAGIEPEEHFFDDWVEYGSDEIQDALQNKGIDLKEYDPVVIAAAVSGLSKSSDGKLSTKNLNNLALKLNEYQTKHSEYKNNETEIKLIEEANRTSLHTLTEDTLKLQEVNRKLAEQEQKRNSTLTFGALTGKPVDNKAEEEVSKLTKDRDVLLDKIKQSKDAIQNFQTLERQLLADKLKKKEKVEEED